jgi:hypothetical protein
MLEAALWAAVVLGYLVAGGIVVGIWNAFAASYQTVGGEGFFLWPALLVIMLGSVAAAAPMALAEAVTRWIRRGR